MKLNLLLEEAIVGYEVHVDNHAFVPHLSLGRIKHSTAVQLPELKIPTTKIKVNKIQLFRSDPGEQGSVYTALDCVSLGGGL